MSHISLHEQEHPPRHRYSARYITNLFHCCIARNSLYILFSYIVIFFILWLFSAAAWRINMFKLCVDVLRQPRGL